MKISEAIIELERIKQSSGDLEVDVWPYDGQVATFPAESIYVLNGKVIFDHEKNEWFRDYHKEISQTRSN